MSYEILGHYLFILLYVIFIMKSKAKIGDKIKVILVKEEYTGILLESPEPGIILLKLDSGYNLGFKKKDIREIKLITDR